MVLVCSLRFSEVLSGCRYFSVVLYGYNGFSVGLVGSRRFSEVLVFSQEFSVVLPVCFQMVFVRSQWFLVVLGSVSVVLCCSHLFS